MRDALKNQKNISIAEIIVKVVLAHTKWHVEMDGLMILPGFENKNQISVEYGLRKSVEKKR